VLRRLWGGNPGADPNRIVLLGQSTGGLPVTAAAANPPGVIGVLDFAGGAGSNAPDHATQRGSPGRGVCDAGDDCSHPGAVGRVVYAEKRPFLFTCPGAPHVRCLSRAGAPVRLVDAATGGDGQPYGAGMAPHDVTTSARCPLAQNEDRATARTWLCPWSHRPEHVRLRMVREKRIRSIQYSPPVPLAGTGYGGSSCLDNAGAGSSRGSARCRVSPGSVPGL
jgi:hypothetical protein